MMLLPNFESSIASSIILLELSLFISSTDNGKGLMSFAISLHFFFTPSIPPVTPSLNSIVGFVVTPLTNPIFIYFLMVSISPVSKNSAILFPPYFLNMEIFSPTAIFLSSSAIKWVKRT